ncbi:polyprenyl synthetase family protein [uncultured Eubacterium sp.]|uniref:polyprenyl synthetase family protein n=1 Tax=uncultured Eubacterium sp. TaxID=165185 RepID=UPI0025D1CD39|nr:farnesyl diphosphate synthase [uncultured Eubacterium sp.]
MYSPDFKAQLEKYCDVVNTELMKYIPEANDGQRDVTKAMRYSLSNGGKRLRPIFVLEFCRMCGGDVNKALPYACAIEYIHTYSLIHDDLPCMDNDDMRRGKPSCHKMYGEATALLAGDALLTHAFDICSASELSDSQNLRAVSLLSQNAGVGGMIGGQVIDLKYEQSDPSISDILTVHRLKTGALISAACILGCIAAGADDEKIALASRYAYMIGTAFQIRDDLLDIMGDEEKLGKPVGSDADNDKTTYVTLVGADRAQQDVKTLTDKAVEILDSFSENDFMKTLSEYLVNREK